MRLLHCEFFTRDLMSRHREHAHGFKRADKTLVYKCAKCDYCAIYECDISRHRRRHKYATASCRHCNRPFFNIENLKEHLKHEHDRGEERIKVLITKLKKRDTSQRRCGRKRKICNDVGHKERKRCSNDVCKGEQKKVGIKNRKTAPRYEKKEDDSSEEISTAINTDYKNEGNEDTENIENENHIDTCDRTKLPKLVRFKETCETSVKDSFTRSLKHKQTNPTKMLNEKLYRAKTTLKSIDGATVRKETERSSFVHMTLDNPKINNARVRKLMKCTFCEFKAKSLKDLQTHLDTHDYETDQYEDADSQNASVGSDFDTAGPISTSDSNIVGEPNCYVTKCLISVEARNTECDQMRSDSGVSSTTQSDNECSELENVYSTSSVPVDQIKSDRKEKDEFIKKPFACSKCFFSTGNLFQLKHHVVAHLYEKATLGYNNNQSDAASLTVRPFLPSLSCGIQGIVKPFPGHVCDNTFNLDLKRNKETCSDFLYIIPEINSKNLLRPKSNHINDKGSTEIITQNLLVDSKSKISSKLKSATRN